MDLKLYKECKNILVLSPKAYTRLYTKLGRHFSSKMNYSGAYSMNFWYFLDKKLETSNMCAENKGYLFDSNGEVHEITFNFEKDTFKCE